MYILELCEDPAFNDNYSRILMYILELCEDPVFYDNYSRLMYILQSCVRTLSSMIITVEY